MVNIDNGLLKTFMRGDLVRHNALEKIIELTKSDSHNNTSNLIDILKDIQQIAKEALNG